MSVARVRTGLDVLAAQAFAPLRGRRVGLVTHPAAVDVQLRHVARLLHHAPGVDLVRLFGPEHGFVGHAQDLEGVAAGSDPMTGLPVVSLYGKTIESLRPTAEQLRDLDVLVIDLVDIGSRYYTFQATMLFCMEEAAKLGMSVMILDRPNPIGGLAVEGPTIRPGFTSFVGIQPMTTRHGLTIGELARLYQHRLALGNELTIVPCEGWKRNLYHGDTGLPWVLPSPNMPTEQTALVYPGMCLLEGTNLSEGRGTTRPFELVGARGVASISVTDRLNGAKLPGVSFRPAWFTPTFQKHAGQLCGGVQLHVGDREAFQPVRTGLTVLAVLRQAAGERFAWRMEAYEFVNDIPAIDLLFGSDRERLGLEAGKDPAELAKAWEVEEEQFRRERVGCLLYD